MRGGKSGIVSAVITLSAAILFALQGCQSEPPVPVKPTVETKPADGHDEKGHDEKGHAKEGEHAHDHHHDHAEKGPHGGTLVAIGDEAAHVEIVLDPATGKLTAFVLDGEAKKAVALKQAEIKLAIEVPHADAKKGDLPESHELPLAAVDATAAGEASEFAGQADELKGAKEFHVVLPALTIGDKKFEPIEFKYPEGNEHDHHHH